MHAAIFFKCDCSVFADWYHPMSHCSYRRYWWCAFSWLIWIILSSSPAPKRIRLLAITCTGCQSDFIRIMSTALISKLDERQSPAFCPPGANAPAKLRSYWTKVTKFLSDVDGSRMVLAHASLLRSSCPVHCGMSVYWMKVGMPIFADLRQKSITVWQCPLSEKWVTLIMLTHICIYPEILR